MLHSNNPLHVEKCLSDGDFRCSKYFIRFLMAIAYSAEPKLVWIKISCNLDNLKMLLIVIQQSASCLKPTSI